MSNYDKAITWLQLEANYQTKFNSPSTQWMSLLRDRVDEEKGLEFFESFNTKLSDFKGQVGSNRFKLKRRRRLIDFNTRLALIEGQITTERDQSTVAIHISLEPTTLKLAFGAMVALYGLFFILFLTQDFGVENSFFISLIPLHGLLMFAIMYFILRYEVKVSRRVFDQFLTSVVSQA